MRIPRSVIAVIPILTLCVLLLMGEKVPDNFFTLVGMILAFYFTAKTSEIKNGKGGKS